MKFQNLLQNIFNNERIAGWVFILPALLGTLIFIVIPVICSFGLSFTKWDLLNPIRFVGLDNYKEIFSEALFFKIFWNTVVFAISTSVLGVIIPLILACILNSKIRGSEFYKTAYFLPFITPMIVIGVVWEWIFDPNIGLLNHILHLHINWLYDTHFAMPALIIVSVWKLIGYNMVIFLSSLSGISQSMFEAAKIDGATPFQTFKNVTIPLLSPSIFFVVIITAISSFQVFDLIYLMTQGGPLDSTNVLVYAIYKNAFEYFNIGKASAIAYVLFFIILVLTLVQWSLRKKLVYNED
ncbi:binding-protein-dependent transport systems inner membrane component [Clostridium sp. CAG:715]|nr:binding-protein-dependent transport systems inner membrane component [Clostridium sp. CAG:715]